MNPTVYILSRNHFDNTWRRCWDRSYEHGGKSYVGYVTVERAVIDAMGAIAARDDRYAFEIESSRLLRRYLQDHPDSLDAFEALWEQGRFALLGSGEVIPDANMTRGETLVRNLAEGIWWSEEAFGRRPVVGWHADGFGSSGQFPQIFAGVGLRWIAALSYQTPSRDYWKGLDGTVAFIGTLPNQNVVDYVKYPPCPICAGQGCYECDLSGLHFIRRLEAGTWIDDLKEPAATLTFFGEEVLPAEDLPEAVAAHESGVEYVFGTHETLLEIVGERIAACDAPPAEEISPEPDGNPTTSGCLVSRVELKRRHRFAEAALTLAETWSTLTGRDAAEVQEDMPRTQAGSESSIRPWEESREGYSPILPRIRDLWRDLCFGAFHDALPGTLIDSAYAEVMELYNHLEDACAAHLCAGDGTPRALFNAVAKAGGVREIWPVVPLPDGPIALRIGGEEIPVLDRATTPEGTERLWADLPAVGVGAAVDVEVVQADAGEPETLADGTIRWSGDRVHVEAGAAGITELQYDDRTYLHRGPWGVGEPIVEKDVGDPWATRDPDRPRRGTACTARRVSAVRTDRCLELVYEGTDPDAEPRYQAPDPMVLRLNWTQRWRFYRDHPYVDLRTEIDWSSYNRRVRLAFPTGWPTDDLWTEIPFGVLKRPRYEMSATGWNNAGGDWPAVGWGGLECAGSGLAVLNRGTPSYRCEDGTLLISVLRSPAFPNCLEEPDSYSAPDYEGMRDPGRRVFEHRIVPYTGSWADAGIVEQAEAFNAPVVLTDSPGPATGLTGVPDGVVVSAIKPARSGEGLVIRLVAMTGKAHQFELGVPGPFRSAVRTNLLEDELSAVDVTPNGVAVEIAPWQIVTLLLR